MNIIIFEAPEKECPLWRQKHNVRGQSQSKAQEAFPPQHQRWGACKPETGEIKDKEPNAIGKILNWDSKDSPLGSIWIFKISKWRLCLNSHEPFLAYKEICRIFLAGGQEFPFLSFLYFFQGFTLKTSPGSLPWVWPSLEAVPISCHSRNHSQESCSPWPKHRGNKARTTTPQNGWVTLLRKKTNEWIHEQCFSLQFGSKPPFRKVWSWTDSL